MELGLLVNRLLDGERKKNVQGFHTVPTYPFFAPQEFSFEYWSLGDAPVGVVARYRGVVVGFREFIGPEMVSTRDTLDLAPFYGFKAHNGRQISQALGEENLLAFAFFVQEDIRQKFSGIGRALHSVSLGVMRELLEREGRLDPKSYLFISQDCRTPVYVRHFGGVVVADYLDDGIDVAIPIKAKIPLISITPKEGRYPAQSNQLGI